MNRPIAVVALAVCSGVSAQQASFPHITINADERYIDVECTVPITLDDPDAPHVYLELIACTPDTKEHESLVVTQARPSHVHAALLLLGLEPGEPGTWEWEGDAIKPIPPKGPAIEVTLHYAAADGEEIVARPAEWIVHMETGESFPSGDWVFAGSRIVQWRGEDFYDADGSGALVGLTTFGSEVIAWSTVISPEASIEEPVWLADEKTVPPMNTPVTMRLRVIEDADPDD